MQSINGVPLWYIESVFKIDSSSKTGLSWRIRRDSSKKWNSKHGNKVAGYRHKSNVNKKETWRVDIKYGYNVYKLFVHRVVWLLSRRDIGCVKIGHKNGDSLDNRVENLKELIG